MGKISAVQHKDLPLYTRQQTEGRLCLLFKLLGGEIRASREILSSFPYNGFQAWRFLGQGSSSLSICPAVLPEYKEKLDLLMS